jgi:exonuclease VII large subunit
MIQLSSEMDRSLAGARTGAILTLVLTVVSLGLMGFWLKYAHDEFVGKYGTPEFAMDQLVVTASTQLKEYTPELKKQVLDYAPTALDYAEQRLQEIPDRFADDLMSRTKQELDTLTPKLEEELYKSLKTALADARAQRKPNVSDETYIKQTVDALANTYEGESIKLIDDLRGKYTKGGADVLAYLEFLADNKGLDHKQSLQRQALTTFLTIASRAKHQAM